jgi:hypothetical protein
VQRIAHQARATSLQPGEAREQCRLAHRHNARLVALAMDAQLLAVDIEISDLEPHQFVGAKPAAVGKLKHRAVAQAERPGAAGGIEQAARIGGGEHAREVVAALGSTEPRGRALRNEAVLAEAAVERADRCDASRDGRRRQAALGERRQIAAQIGQRDGLRQQVAFAGPSREVDQISLVGGTGALRQRTAREVGLQEHDRGRPRIAMRVARQRGRTTRARGEGRSRRRGRLVGAKVAAVGVFYIHVHEGHIATLDQLAEAEIIEVGDDPVLPWHRIDASSDATTMWYAAMRKRENGIFLGTLTFRHCDHHSLLLEGGWEEVPVEEIGPPGL